MKNILCLIYKQSLDDSDSTDRFNDLNAMDRSNDLDFTDRSNSLDAISISSVNKCSSSFVDHTPNLTSFFFVLQFVVKYFCKYEH